MLDDITCRLNVNSITRVYSVSLPAFILYALFAKKSRGFNKFIPTFYEMIKSYLKTS